MKPKLVLTLMGDHLTLEVINLPETHGWRRLLGPFARSHASGSVLMPPKRLAHIGVSFEASSASLSETFEGAWRELKRVCRTPIDGNALEARIGLAHARLGLLTLADAENSSMTPSAGDLLAKTWAKQISNIDAATQIIRWQVLESSKELPSRLLISSITRLVYETLNTFAEHHGLRFVSCKPALLTILDDSGQLPKTASPSRTISTTFVCTESASSARRANVVQLLRYENGQLLALWRGWLHVPSSPESPDDALEGAIRRFQACHKAQPGEALRRQHWPARLPT